MAHPTFSREAMHNNRHYGRARNRDTRLFILDYPLYRTGMLGPHHVPGAPMPGMIPMAGITISMYTLEL